MEMGVEMDNPEDEANVDNTPEARPECVDDCFVDSDPVVS